MAQCRSMSKLELESEMGRGLGKMTDGQANQDKNINFNFKKSQSEPLEKWYGNHKCKCNKDFTNICKWNKRHHANNHKNKS